MKTLLMAWRIILLVPSYTGIAITFTSLLLGWGWQEAVRFWEDAQ